MDTLSILGYSSGEYDDYNAFNFGIFLSLAEAKEYETAFNQIHQWYKEKLTRYWEESRQFSFGLGEYPKRSKLNKESKPEWKAMDNRQWQIYLKYRKTELPLQQNEYDRLCKEREVKTKEFNDQWWKKEFETFPPELVKYQSACPVNRDNGHGINGFFIEEVPVISPIA